MVNCRKQHSCVYLNSKVYVISGYDGKIKVWLAVNVMTYLDNNGKQLKV